MSLPPNYHIETNALGEYSWVDEKGVRSFPMEFRSDCVLRAWSFYNYMKDDVKRETWKKE